MNFAAIAEAGSHVDELAALYDGTLELEGLEIDTDLGWELLIALVAAGRAGDAEIDERLAADNTATGQQSAAHARAAIQTLEGKERAWSSLIDVDTATNTVVRETAEGFLRANDPALLEAFVERYFAMLERHLGRAQLRDRREARRRPLPVAAREPRPRRREPRLARRPPRRARRSAAS